MLRRTAILRASAVVALCSADVALSAEERPAAADGPLAEAIAAARVQEPVGPYAYTRHLLLDTEDEQIDRVERFDPRHPRGERWQLLRQNGQAPSRADLADYDPEAAGDEGENAFAVYRTLLAELEVDNAILVELGPERALYRLKETKASFLDESSREFAERLTSRIVIDRTGPQPFLSRFDLTADAPFSVSLLADIERFDMRFDYRRMTDTGDILPEQVLIDIAIDALVFVSVDAKTRIAFSDFEPIPAP